MYEFVYYIHEQNEHMTFMQPVKNKKIEIK